MCYLKKSCNKLKIYLKGEIEKLKKIQLNFDKKQENRQ